MPFAGSLRLEPVARFGADLCQLIVDVSAVGMPPRHGTLHIDRPALAEPVFEFQRRHQYRVVKQIGFDREGNRTAVFGDLSVGCAMIDSAVADNSSSGAVILRFRNGRLRSRRFRNAGNILSCRPCAADCRRNRSGRRLPNAVFPVGRRVQVFDADQCHDVLHAVVGKRLVRKCGNTPLSSLHGR